MSWEYDRHTLAKLCPGLGMRVAYDIGEPAFRLQRKGLRIVSEEFCMSVSHDPYAPPVTLVADAEDGSAAARRPLLVWIIAIYFGLTGLALLGAVVAVWQRLLPLDADAQHYMEHHAIAAYALSVTMVVLYLCAARSLFLLRVRAPQWLLACVVVNVVDTVIDWAVGYTATLTVGSFITGLLIPAVVCAYAYHLRRKGVLR